MLKVNMDRSDYKKRKVDNDDVHILLSLTIHQHEQEQEQQHCVHYEPPEPYHFEENEEDNYNNNIEEVKVVTEKAPIYYFTYDVYKISENGSKPGKYVFLTKDCRLNPEDGEFEWKVKEILHNERSSRRRRMNTNDSIWYEKECNLKKKCYGI